MDEQGTVSWLHRNQRFIAVLLDIDVCCIVKFQEQNNFMFLVLCLVLINSLFTHTVGRHSPGSYNSEH